ncbi:MAG: hypothetical protein RJA07_161 [Bacteroidota bacterium]|jgi:hypothetical protein
MIKKFLFLICFIPACAFAKKISIDGVDSPPSKYTQYIGVQSNLLIRQVLNLSGNTATTNNPYLFTYSINNKKGWGLATGLGLTTSNNFTSDATGSYNKNNTKSMNVRLGIEKRFVLSSKWNALAGIDGVMNMNKNTSDVKTIQTFGSTTTNSNTTTTTKNLFGGGLRAALSYAITPKLFIGTETSIVFTTGKEKFSGTTSSDDGLGNTNSNSTSNSSNESGFDMNVPTAFFIILKF